MPADEKYIVFKRDDWEQHKLHSGCIPEEFALEDAVVIRKQDIFAGPALHAYASSISTAIEILDRTTDGMLGSVVPRLDEIRTYFFEQANDADNIQAKKVPD